MSAQGSGERPTRRTAITKPLTAREKMHEIARDVGKQVVHHIKIMYPDAVAACPSTFLLSVRGCVHNNFMAAIDSEEDVMARIARNEAHRKHIEAMYRKIRNRGKV